MTRASMTAMLFAVLLLGLGACAGIGLRDPVVVDVVGIDPLPGEGMESRFALKLRIQNPNEQPIDYNGIYVELEVGGSRLASGVSDQHGTVPRFGESVISLPVSVTVAALVRQALSLASGERTRTDYTLRGKLSGTGFGGYRFESNGQMQLPAMLLGTTPR